MGHVDTADGGDSNFIHSAIDEGEVRLSQVLVVAAALLLNMLDGFDVTAMAFTAHDIGVELSIAADQLGILFSVALAGMVAGAMFIAPLSDRFGRRVMILISVLFIGFSMFLTGYAESLLSLCILRAITGLGAGGMLASLAAVSSEYAPVKYKSFAVAIVTAGYPLGATIGSFVAAPLMVEYGWRSVFFFGGAATIGMFLLTFYMIPESLQFLVSKRPKNALQKVNKILTRLQCSPIDELPPQPPAQEVVKTSVGALLSEQWRGKTLVLWTTFFFCFITLYFLMSWVPKLVVNSGMTVSEGVYAAAAFNGGGVMGILSLGYLSAHFALSRMISFFLFLSGTMMAIFAATSGLDYLLLYLVTIGFLLQGGFTGLYAAAAKMYPTEVRAAGVGWGIGLGRLGAVAGPYIGGILIATGLSMEMNFFVFAVPMLISGFMATRLGVK